MKRIIFSAIGLLLLHIGAFGQSNGSWTGSDVPGHNYAEFKDFTGKQDFKLLLPSTGNVIHLKYEISKKTGTLHFIIKSSSDQFLDTEILTPKVDSLTIIRKPGETYKIYIRGKDAAGSFNITYSSGDR